eukprot:1111666_1
MSVNKTTIQIQNASQFPPLPSMWMNRFDVRIWNELQSVGNDALADLKAHKRNMNCTTFLVGFITSSIILASAMIGMYAGSAHEYCCDDGIYAACQEYCYEEDEGAFIFSMIITQSIESISKPNSTPQPQQPNMSLQDKMQMYFKSMNDRYQNMMLFNVTSVHFPSGCPCCNDYQLMYYELQIEMRVQHISYIPDPQSSALPQQHMQQPLQIVSSLPTQQQMQQHASFNEPPPPFQIVTSLSTQQQMQQNQQPIQVVNTFPTQYQMQQQNSLNDGGYKEKHYTQWTTNDVLRWLMQLDNGSFAPYQQTLARALNNEQIDGNDLFDLDKNDLHRLGIQTFKLKKSLLAHIQSLS